MNTTVAFAKQVGQIAAAANLGTATAAKRGRNPEWPYVPVIHHVNADGTGEHTTQIKGKAFATRDEAVEYAQANIDHQRLLLAGQLLNPRYRALRAQHGLPRELP